MGWRVAAAEKNSIKGVISPDTDLKKTRKLQVQVGQLHGRT